MSLIKKHLHDPLHPLSKLHQEFSTELKEYYELFLEVNYQQILNMSEDKGNYNKNSIKHDIVLDSSIDECGDPMLD